MSKSDWLRPIAFVAAILFLVSWIFPIGAGLAKDTSAFPKSWGTIDVVLAFTLAILAFGIQTQARGKLDPQAADTTYCVYRAVTHAIILVAVLVIAGGDRIRWANCATGFLWRAWLGLYILPWWLVATRSPEIGHL